MGTLLSFLRLSALIAAIIFGAIGGVALMVSGWTILLAPFWIAACVLVACKCAEGFA